MATVVEEVGLAELLQDQLVAIQATNEHILIAYNYWNLSSHLRSSRGVDIAQTTQSRLRNVDVITQTTLTPPYMHRRVLSPLYVSQRMKGSYKYSNSYSTWMNKNNLTFGGQDGG